MCSLSYSRFFSVGFFLKFSSVLEKNHMHRKLLKDSLEWRAWGWLWMNPQPAERAA